MAEHGDVPYIIIERQSGGLGGFLWGAMVGAALGLLYAPRAGTETRRDLQDRAQRLRDTAEGTVRRVQDTLNDTLGDVRREVTDRVDAARGAVDAGRAAARETRADLERRVRESQAAVRAGVEAARRGPHAEGAADRPSPATPPTSPIDTEQEEDLES